MQVHYSNIIHSLLLYVQACLWETEQGSDVMDAHCNTTQGQMTSFKSVDSCNTDGFGKEDSVVCDLDGTLTRSRNIFPYYMLIAYEGGSPLRGLALLVLYPLIWLVHGLVSEAAGIHMLIFISMAGLKVSVVESVGRAVLSRFYLEDMHPMSYRVLISCGKRCVVTSNPRVMVQPFLKDYLGVDLVIGTELHSVKGYCTGLLLGPGVLMGVKKMNALKKVMMDKQPEVGLGSDAGDHQYLSVCKDGYLVSQKRMDAVPKEHFIKPLIFHDGRLVKKPTQLVSLFIYLWLPIGLVLSLLRLFVWLCLPFRLALPLSAALGIRVRFKGSPPERQNIQKEKKRGILYVCSHKTVLDGVILSMIVKKKLAVVIYSVSKLVEVFSPVKTVRLVRDRAADAKAIDEMLNKEDVMICPEGTTCREPYLLRFSPLFAELSNDIVPVGTYVEMQLFHGTTARGLKFMDPFYFLMNPFPLYTLTVLNQLPVEETCASGKSAVDVANHIQRLLGLVMGYHCTEYTRKQKYRILAGNDGIVPSSTWSVSTF